VRASRKSRAHEQVADQVCGAAQAVKKAGRWWQADQRGDVRKQA